MQSVYLQLNNSLEPITLWQPAKAEGLVADGTVTFDDAPRLTPIYLITTNSLMMNFDIPKILLPFLPATHANLISLFGLQG